MEKHDCINWINSQIRESPHGEIAVQWKAVVAGVSEAEAKLHRDQSVVAACDNGMRVSIFAAFVTSDVCPGAAGESERRERETKRERGRDSERSLLAIR